MLKILTIFFFSLPFLVEGKPCQFKKIPLQYAKNVTLHKLQDIYRIDIKGEQPLFLYKKDGATCGEGRYIKIPIKKIATFSTTYIGFLNRLESLGSVQFVSTMKYVFSSTVKNSFKNGKIVELGYPPRSELILKHRPDVILDFPPLGVMPTYLRPTIQAKIPVVFIKEHYEQHPLARAEWIKVFALLVNKESEGNKIFNKMVSRYKKIEQQISSVDHKNRPVTLVGKLLHGVWHAPAKKSYLVQFLRDLNVEYLFSNKTAGRLLLPFEEVLKASTKASFWLPQALWQKQKDIFKSDRKYRLLNEQLKKNIFSNSLNIGVHGGSDYWESGVAYPDRILSDLAQIFYPKIVKKKKFFYYQKL